MQTNIDRQTERRFARTVILLVVLGFAAVSFAGLSALGVMVQTEERTKWVNHTYEVERAVSGIRLALEQMRSARRGFMLGLPVAAEASYPVASRHLFDGIANVSRLTIDNPYQQDNVHRLSAMAGTLDQLFRRSMTSSSIRETVAERERQQLATRVERLTLVMLREEQRLLVQRDGARKTSQLIFYWVLTATAVLLAFVGFGSVWVIRRYTGQLLASQTALQALNENLEEAVGERTADLRRANDEIQRFAYIVSHDLRSPLVNVMGFTAELDSAIATLATMIDKVEAEAPELADKDATIAVREDLPEAIGFIRSSTQKMDRLINAILRLSREGRRAIAPEPLDLTALAKGVIDALHHRIAELGVTVNIAPKMPVLVSDRLAVEQILSNLVENAVKYLKPGRPGQVDIATRFEPGRILIDVTDNGRGIESRDHERIFDLFRRSGAQDQPGEGIGLAHVRALAYRLGGTISVASEFGEGATFTINLPAEFTGEKAALS